MPLTETLEGLSQGHCKPLKSPINGVFLLFKKMNRLYSIKKDLARSYLSDEEQQRKGKIIVKKISRVWAYELMRLWL